MRKPLDPTEFVDELREEMRAELDALHAALPRYDWLTISDRASGAITLTPLAAAPEPGNLRRLKQAVHTRWGMVPLIDMLKEAVLRTGCLRGVTSVADRGNLPEDVLAERLLLAIYAYGTNTGIRAVASDSMHFGSFDQNIFTEWHSRYGGRGVLIYWHVEKGSVVIHSQLLNCSASEVHAMVDGAIRHGTDMAVEANYVDTHGQSEIGFGITRLLGFDLLPRIKRINKVKLYRPAAGEPDLWPGLAPAMTRPIRWPVGQQRQANESFDALERRHHGIADMRDTGVDRRWLCVESGTACIICLLCAGQRLDGAAGQLHRLLAGSVSQWAGR